MADTVSEQIAALSDEDWAIREEAATLLGSAQGCPGGLPLTKSLRDADRAVREAAIGALSSLGARVGSGFGRLFGGSGVAGAGSGIGHFGLDCRCAGFAPLVDALSSRDWIVRMHAAKGLGADRRSGSRRGLDAAAAG